MDSPSKRVDAETDVAIRRLIARHAQLVDDRTFDPLPELYIEEGKFILGGEQHVGRTAVRAFAETTPSPSLHQVTNVVVSLGSRPHTFHAVSDLLFLLRVEGSWSIVGRGRYHDTFVEQDGDLHFSQRILTLL